MKSTSFHFLGWKGGRNLDSGQTKKKTRAETPPIGPLAQESVLYTELR